MIAKRRAIACGYWDVAVNWGLARRRPEGAGNTPGRLATQPVAHTTGRGQRP